MTQEDNQKCSNSSSGGGVGGRSSKKSKQKKVPQRGLGVAQLEKIRLEEQQKKEGATGGGGGGGGGGGNVVPSSSFVFLPLPKQSSSTISLPPPPSPSELSGFRPNLDLLSPPPPLPSKTTFYAHNGCSQSSVGGSSIGGVGGIVPRHGYFPSTWNPTDYDGEASKLDPRFTFQPHLLSDFNPTSPTSLMVHRKQHPKLQNQQPSSEVNISIPLSSGSNRPMEPPSNQSYYSNYTLPLWPDEEKMVGKKRPWPFAVDHPPGPSLPFSFPQFVPHIYRFEDSSYGNGATMRFESGNAVFSDGPLGPTSHSVNWTGGSSDLNSKSNKDNGALDTLLTLGPSATNSVSMSKAKQPLDSAASHYPEFSESSMFPYQGYMEDPLLGQGRSVQPSPLPFYSFFPPKGQQVEYSVASSNNQRGEVSDRVDLNLKL